MSSEYLNKTVTKADTTEVDGVKDKYGGVIKKFTPEVDTESSYEEESSDEESPEDIIAEHNDDLPESLLNENNTVNNVNSILLTLIKMLVELLIMFPLRRFIMMFSKLSIFRDLNLLLVLHLRSSFLKMICAPTS